MVPEFLVADGEPTIRNFLSGLPESEGYTVIAAADGDEALAIILAKRPDLLITDNMMPRLGDSLFSPPCS